MGNIPTRDPWRLTHFVLEPTYHLESPLMWSDVVKNIKKKLS